MDTETVDTEATEGTELDSGGDDGYESTDTGTDGSAEGQDSAEQPEFSDELLKRAADAGLSRSEVENFGSPEAVERVLVAFENEMARRVGQKETREQPTDSEPDLVLDEDLLDPDVVSAFKQQDARMKKLEQKLAAAESENQRREEAEFESRCEGRFQSLGDEYKDLLGKGPSSGLGPRTKAFRNRKDVKAEMLALKAGYIQTGRAVPDEGDLFHRALRSLFGEQQETLTRRKIEGRVKSRKGKQINRPGNRERKTQSDPTETAVRDVDAFMRDKGIGVYSPDI